jgi:hypothetical protein
MVGSASTPVPRPLRSTRPVRLEFADDLFARRHRGLGSPVVNQWVWRLDGPYDPAHVRRLGDGLAAGGLSRLLHRASVPGARDVWTNSPQLPAVDLRTEPLPRAELIDWLRARHAEPLDPHQGRTWRLFATDLDDGTGVVCLILAHAVGDGGSVIDAVSRAANGAEPLRLPALPTSRWERLVSDGRDAAGQLGAIAGWARARVSAHRNGTGAKAVRRTPPAPVPVRPGAEDWDLPRLTVELDSADVAAVGARHGGSANAWFIAAMARMLVAIGHVPEDGGPVPISLPVSEFRPGDTRSNSTRITRVEMPRDVLEARDLAEVKALCKAAYTALADAGTGFAPIPLALVQMLPDRLIKLLPTPPSAACLASNLGGLPADYVAAGGERVRSVAAMACYQDASAAAVRAMGGGLLAWLVDASASTDRARTTLTVIAAEPDRLGGVEALHTLVLRELGSWGLAAEVW